MKTKPPCTSLKGFNQRLTRDLFGYAGGEVVTRSALAAAEAEFDYDREESPKAIGRDYLEPGCEYKVTAATKAELVLDGKWYGYDRPTMRLILLAKIIRRNPHQDFPDTYAFRQGAAQ